MPFIPFDYFLKISITLATTRCKIKIRLKTWTLFSLVLLQASGFKFSIHRICLFSFSLACFWQHPECVLLIFSLLIITKKCVPYVWFGWEALLPVSAILIMETRSVCLACVCRRMGFGRHPIGLGHSSHDSHHTPAPSYCPNRPCRLAPRSWKALKYDKTLKVNFCLLVFAVRTAERGWNPIK